MILREVVLHNFGPYRGRVEIDLSPTGHGRARPIVLVGALNGSGKTSLLDGILLALYGSRARCSSRKGLSYPEFLRQSINARAAPDEGASVTVEFDYPTSRGTSRLRIVRLWRQNPKGVAESATVFRDGQEDAELSETWAERVEDLLPLGVSNLFFFDGEQVRDLASSSQATPEVRTAIRTLLGLELPQQLQNDLSIVIARRRKALVSSPLDREVITKLESDYRRHERERHQVAERIGELRNSRDSLRRALEVARQSFKASGGELASQHSEISRELEIVRAQQGHVRDRLRDAAAGALPLAFVLTLVDRALLRAHVERQHLDDRHLLARLEERDAKLLSVADAAGVSRKVMVAIRDHLGTDRASLINPMDEPVYLAATREDIATATGSLAAVREDQSVVEDAVAQLRRLESKANGLEAQLATSAPMEDVNVALDSLERLQMQFANVEGELAALVARHDEAARDSVRIHSDLERKYRQLMDLEAAADDDARVVREAERVARTMDAFKARLLSRRLHDLEREVTERFAHLSRKRGFINRILVDPETFELSLYDVDGLQVQRDRMSAGEQQLLAVAFLWALAITSGRNLPVVIDTPLGRMDHDHRRSLVERYFPHASHQVILLSTDAEIDERYREQLAELGAIDREYLVRFDVGSRRSYIEPGYFWS